MPYTQLHIRRVHVARGQVFVETDRQHYTFELNKKAHSFDEKRILELLKQHEKNGDQCVIRYIPKKRTNGSALHTMYDVYPTKPAEDR